MAVEGDYDYFRNVSDLLAAGRKFTIPSKHVDAALRIGVTALQSAAPGSAYNHQHPFRRLDYLRACARPHMGNNNVAHLC